MLFRFVHMACYTWWKEGISEMPAGKGQITHKHFRLDAAKLKRAQKVMAAATETETVDRALDLAISEYKRNRLAQEANQRFLKSGIVVRDVLGALGE